MAGSFIGEGNLSTTGKLKGHLRMIQNFLIAPLLRS
jgi:hypothetical protein